MTESGGRIARWTALGGAIGAARYGLPKTHVDSAGKERQFTTRQRIGRGVAGGLSGATAGAYLGHSMNKLPEFAEREAGKLRGTASKEMPHIAKGPKPTGFKTTPPKSNKIEVSSRIKKEPAIKVVTKPGPEDLQEVIKSRKGLLKNASISLDAFYDELTQIWR